MTVSFKRWACNYRLILTDIITCVGIFWLLVDILSYSTNGETDSITKNIAFFSVMLLVIAIYSLCKNKPKSAFSHRLRDKDNFVEIKVGDAFHNEGALVIPINNHFDVSLGGNVRKAKSLQNKLIKEYYSNKEKHLKKDIEDKINLIKVHDIGTTIEIEQKGKIFYLLANSRKKNNNRVESTVEDFLLSLSKLWEYIATESGRNSTITIPLISTNHGRIANLSRSTAVKEIIRSYIDSSKSLNIADRLIISIHPDDINKGTLNLDEIDEFLRFSCKYYKKIELSHKPEGEEISASTIKNLNN